MRKFLFLAVLVFVAVSVSGCFIDMTATTKINDDGSGFRITTYTADGATEMEETVKKYILPSGGEWRLGRYAENSPPQHTYEVKRAFRDLNSLTPDYTRKGAKRGDLSENGFSLKIKNAVIFTVYEYEETFRDCTDAAKIREFCGDWYSHSLETAAREVARAFPSIVKKDKVKALLDARYRPYFDYFLASFLEYGRGAFDEKNTAFQVKLAEYEEKYSAGDFSRFLADHIMSLDGRADRKAVTEKLMAVHASIDKQFSDYGEALMDRNYDDAFGVYGWPIFMGYSFNISVLMPGRIIEANTGDVKSNSAKWEFTNDDFFLKEFKLRARSRRLNPPAIGIMAAILAAALFAAYKRGCSKK